jgi:hypothetical protein
MFHVTDTRNGMNSCSHYTSLLFMRRAILRGPLTDTQNSIDLQTLINGVYHLSVFDKQGGVVHAQNILVQK